MRFRILFPWNQPIHPSDLIHPPITHPWSIFGWGQGPNWLTPFSEPNAFQSILSGWSLEFPPNSLRPNWTIPLDHTTAPRTARRHDMVGSERQLTLRSFRNVSFISAKRCFVGPVASPRQVKKQKKYRLVTRLWIHDSVDSINVPTLTSYVHTCKRAFVLAHFELGPCKRINAAQNAQRWRFRGTCDDA